MQDSTGRWGHWSLPIEFVASPPTPTDVVQFLRITELNYHPAADGDAEFIEFKNISSGGAGVTLDLGGVTITKGPSSPFTFVDGTLLSPGEHILVVRNAAVFSATYPYVDPILIAGEYTGGLDNAGETIEVIDSLGNIIHDFRYEDGGAGEETWHASTDGFGPTLVIANENAIVTNWAQGTAWRPSYDLNGSPGEDDCLSGDFNCDGAVNLADLAVLQQNLGTVSGGTRAMGDMNRDGVIGRGDAALLAQRFGAIAPGASPVASPASPAAILAVARDREGAGAEIQSIRRATRLAPTAVDAHFETVPAASDATRTLRVRRAGLQKIVPGEADGGLDPLAAGPNSVRRRLVSI